MANTDELVVPATLLEPLKQGLIKLGYATESTPLSFVQECYHRYVVVRQAGANVQIPHALVFVPKELRDLSTGSNNSGLNSIYIVMRLDFVNMGEEEGLSISIDGTPLATMENTHGIQQDVFINLSTIEAVESLLPPLPNTDDYMYSVQYFENRGLVDRAFHLLLTDPAVQITKVIDGVYDEELITEFSVTLTAAELSKFSGVYFPLTAAEFEKQTEDTLLGRLGTKRIANAPSGNGFTSYNSYSIASKPDNADGAKTFSIVVGEGFGAPTVVSPTEATGAFVVPLMFELTGFGHAYAKSISDNATLRITTSYQGQDHVAEYASSAIDSIPNLYYNITKDVYQVLIYCDGVIDANKLGAKVEVIGAEPKVFEKHVYLQIGS